MRHAETSAKSVNTGLGGVWAKKNPVGVELTGLVFVAEKEGFDPPNVFSSSQVSAKMVGTLVGTFEADLMQSNIPRGDYD